MDETTQVPLQSAWLSRLDPREQAQIQHARHYRANFSHAGAPGHGRDGTPLHAGKPYSP